MEEETEIVREYVNKGHLCDVIPHMLSTYHDIKISHGTLKARLKELGLRSDLHRVCAVRENFTSGPEHSYQDKKKHLVFTVSRMICPAQRNIKKKHEYHILKFRLLCVLE